MGIPVWLYPETHRGQELDVSPLRPAVEVRRGDGQPLDEAAEVAEGEGVDEARQLPQGPATAAAAADGRGLRGEVGFGPGLAGGAARKAAARAHARALAVAVGSVARPAFRRQHVPHAQGPEAPDDALEVVVVVLLLLRATRAPDVAFSPVLALALALVLALALASV